MKKTLVFIAVLLALTGCARPLIKNYYILNYEPDTLTTRKSETPYEKTIRLRPFAIEKIYAKPNIIYRESPYELSFYNDHLWAVRPVDMVSDLIFNHLESINLVKTAVRRIDEKTAPDYELWGSILAIEEYDSDDFWYAHLKIMAILNDYKTGKTIYSRVFDHTRKVESKTPIAVVKTLSEIMDFIASTLMTDLDKVLYEKTTGVELNDWKNGDE
jgi:ABC-type uncharacterized transport system auxiliary subunit